MRIVIKPLGAILLVATIAVLAFLAVTNGRRFLGTSSPPPATPTSASVEPAGEVKRVPLKNQVEVLPGPGGILEASVIRAVPPEAAITLIPAEGKPGGFDKAMRVDVKLKPASAWTVQVIRETKVPVKEGQKLTARFWARSPNQHTINAVFERSDAPYTRSLDKQVKLTPEWKEYSFPFTTPAYASHGAKFDIQAGTETGIFEIAGVQVN
jgi:hypothetical protein